MSEIPKCIDCDFKSGYRANYSGNQRRGCYPRKAWYCNHENAYECARKLNQSKMPGFIASGDSTYKSPPQIKTSPRWCPLREVNSE